MIETTSETKPRPEIARVPLSAAERWLFLSGVSTMPVKGKDQAVLRRDLMNVLLGQWDFLEREQDGVTLTELEREEVEPLEVRQVQLRPLLELLDTILDDGRVTVRQASYLLSAREKLQDAKR